MKLNVAVQMDPIARINIRGDSTFALLLEAQKRGHTISYYTPDKLSLRGEELVAPVQRLSVRDQDGDHFTLGEARRESLASFDVVLLRQDPPFDLAYITSTHFLERIHPKTLVVNNPASVRNAPEKMFVMDFPDLMPPTLISRDLDEINSFRAEHGAVVMKPLHGHGGAAVFRILPQDMNFGSLYDMFSVTFREPWVIQRFLPEVKHGDKRIILVDGEFAGAVNRVPAAGRSALQHGARRCCECDRADAARARNLRAARPRAARARAAVRRHRRDRRQSHRNQRHLADRHPRHRPARRPGRGGEDLGCDREEAGIMDRSRQRFLAGYRSFRDPRGGRMHGIEAPCQIASFDPDLSFSAETNTALFRFRGGTHHVLPFFPGVMDRRASCLGFPATQPAVDQRSGDALPCRRRRNDLRRPEMALLIDKQISGNSVGSRRIEPFQMAQADLERTRQIKLPA